MEDTTKNNTNQPNQNNPNTEEEELSNNDSLKTLQDLIYHQGFMKRNETVKESYKFWDTQPVPKITSTDPEEIGPINTDTDVSKERQEPYKLPTGCQWYDLNLSSDLQMVITYILTISFTSSLEIIT